jgi:ketosteroid isomerase-like protein
MEALKTLEADKNPDVLVALFTDDATLERMTHKTYEGKADAEAFWWRVSRAFEDITTIFSTSPRTTTGWCSSGRPKVASGGKAIRYRGVSSLSFDGDKVKGFRTYYDSAAF